MSLNSIGDFVFLDLKGNVELLKQETQLLRREGVPGVGLKLTGVRGAPFKLRSKVDAATIADANDAYTNYLSYVGDGVFSLIQYGMVFAGYGVGFLVQDVKPALIRANQFVMGGLFPPSLGWIEADWTLCCVALDQVGGSE